MNSDHEKNKVKVLMVTGHCWRGNVSVMIMAGEMNSAGIKRNRSIICSWKEQGIVTISTVQVRVERVYRKVNCSEQLG